MILLLVSEFLYPFILLIYCDSSPNEFLFLLFRVNAIFFFRFSPLHFVFFSHVQRVRRRLSVVYPQSRCWKERISYTEGTCEYADG
jgi:hypothetical protein